MSNESYPLCMSQQTTQQRPSSSYGSWHGIRHILSACLPRWHTCSQGSSDSLGMTILSLVYFDILSLKLAKDSWNNFSSPDVSLSLHWECLLCFSCGTWHSNWYWSSFSLFFIHLFALSNWNRCWLVCACMSLCWRILLFWCFGLWLWWLWLRLFLFGFLLGRLRLLRLLLYLHHLDSLLFWWLGFLFLFGLFHLFLLRLFFWCLNFHLLLFGLFWLRLFLFWFLLGLLLPRFLLLFWRWFCWWSRLGLRNSIKSPISNCIGIIITTLPIVPIVHHSL